VLVWYLVWVLSVNYWCGVGVGVGVSSVELSGW
jgi:hypothetical protein